MSEEKAEYVTESTEPRSDFKREEKYLVIKIDDAREYLTPEGQDRLREIASYIDDMRRLHGKRNKQFVCISDACPYYDEAWALVEKWVTGNTRPEPDSVEEWPKVKLMHNESQYEVFQITASNGQQALVYPDDTALYELIKAKTVSALSSRSGVSVKALQWAMEQARIQAQELERDIAEYREEDGYYPLAEKMGQEFSKIMEIYEELKQSLERKNG